MNILNIFKKRRKLIGRGTIQLRTYIEADNYITTCRRRFGKLSVDGVIGELEKIIKEIRKN